MIPIVGKSIDKAVSSIPVVGDILGGATSATGITGMASGFLKDVPLIGDAVGALNDEVQKNEQRAYTESQNTLAYQRQMDAMREQNAFNADEAQKQRDFSSQESAISREFNAQESQKTRDFNREEAADQRAWQEQMWEKQNEYDTPQAQLQRMLAAGISPAAFGLTDVSGADVGNGASASAGGSASSSPASGVAASSSGAPSVSNAVSDVTSAQMRNLNAQADKAEADAAKANKETSWIDRLNDGTLEYQGVMVRKTDSDIDVNNSLIPVYQAQAENLNAQVEVYKSQVDEIAAHASLMRQQERREFEETSIASIEKSFRHQKLTDEHNVSLAQQYYLASMAAKAAAEGKMITFDLNVAKTAGVKYFVDRIRFDTTKSKYEMRLTKQMTTGDVPMTERDKWNVGAEIVKGLGTLVYQGFMMSAAAGMKKMNSSGYSPTPSSNVTLSY